MLKVSLKHLHVQKFLRYGDIKLYQNARDNMVIYVCIHPVRKAPDDPDQYRTGYDVTQVYRIFEGNFCETQDSDQFQEMSIRPLSNRKAVLLEVH